MTIDIVKCKLMMLQRLTRAYNNKNQVKHILFTCHKKHDNYLKYTGNLQCASTLKYPWSSTTKNLTYSYSTVSIQRHSTKSPYHMAVFCIATAVTGIGVQHVLNHESEYHARAEVQPLSNQKDPATKNVKVTAPSINQLTNDNTANKMTKAFSIDESFRSKEWQMLGEIGNGAYGTVRLAKQETTGDVAAIKIIESNHHNFPVLQREVAALRQIKAWGGHENIIALRDVYMDGFHGQKHVCLVTELAKGGELFEHIVENGPLNEESARSLAQGMCSALRFMHQHGLLHNDIKPENILLSETLSNINTTKNNSSTKPLVKLADFGSAGPASNDIHQRDIILQVGTSAYLAPELLTKGSWSTASDMWALGCVLYITLCGSHPFDLEGTATEQQVRQNIRKESVRFDFDAWTDVSTDAKTVVSKLLEKDPSKRLSAEELLNHPWTKGMITQPC